MTRPPSPSGPARRFARTLIEQFSRQHWPLLVVLAGALAVRAAATIVVILLIRDFLTGVLAEPAGTAVWLTDSFGQAGALWAVVGLLIAVSAAGALATYVNQLTMQRIVRLIELNLMERLLAHLVRLPVSFFDRHHRGDLIESVRQDVSRTRASVAAGLELLVLGAQAAAYAASALVISPRLVLTALPILLLAAIPARWFAAEMRQRSVGLRRHAYRLTDLLLQLFQGMRIIKIYGGEAAEIRHSLARARHYFDDLMAAARIRAVGEVVLETTTSLSAVVIIIVGGFEVMNGRLSVASLVAVLVAMRAIFGPLNKGFALFMQIQRDWASVDRVAVLLATAPDVQDAPDAVPFTGPVDGIRFEHVSFAYADGAPAIHDVSFAVEAGQHVGIVGPSGAGKTTLMSLAVRFYDPGAGRVLLNGRDLRAYQRADLYRRIALVTQDPFLFSATARDNIRYGDPDASDDAVDRAARAAGIHDEIAQLPEGYETVLGIGAHLLSAGQIQRINIARALLKDAPMVMLDEATSHLDPVSDRRVQAALAGLRAGRTTFTIAHRLSSIQHADVILVLDKGRLVGQGVHEDLLRECPLYRRLWDAQHAPSAPTPDMAVQP